MGPDNEGGGEVPAGGMSDADILSAVGGEEGGAAPEEGYSEIDGGNAADQTPAGAEEAASAEAGDAAADAAWTPPSREEWEAVQAQMALYNDLANPQIDALLGGQADAGEQAPAVSGEELAALLQPKQFSLAPELIEKALVEGDAGAVGQMFQDFENVLQHNFRIQMNQAVLNGMSYALPVHRAMDKFYERHPALAGARELVESKLWEARAAHPQANDAQLLRVVERRLAPVLSRAKQIAAQSGPRRSDLSPSPAGGGQAPAPRGRAGGAAPGPPAASDRIRQLEEYAAGGRY